MKSDLLEKTRTQVVWFFFVPLANFLLTRPHPVEHGYVFSMAVGTIWVWWKLVPFFARGRTVDSGGGGFLAVILAVKHLKINIMAWVPRKINK